ncbi:hypothetical protein Plec18167_008782 [Paecilomyces lecythidis]|uniref:Uncharacterized protein n=1 Tax=Paecilomyces lecythidis TaxID=3004212 RepID=A0ABR3WU82_9EURO
MDKKELKTWIQLATELGVEPPSAEKGQSSQKVQQYAVRLKRWMRAMHIDAFFEYCLGHSHSYYTQIPSDESPSESRDGVPLEEDLALTSLLPEWKPKRGRRKAEDHEESRIPKRPMLDTSAAGLHDNEISNYASNFPHSAIPFSAFPDDLGTNDPWTATSPFPHNRARVGLSVEQAQGLRWRPFERHASPAGYPHSAILPANRHASEEFLSVEPLSAVMPASTDRGRTRKRHGPSVSSAWSTHGNSTGRTRGRPPNRAAMSSGQFSAFQVDPERSDRSVEKPAAHSSAGLTLQSNASGQLCSPQKHPLPQSISKTTKLQLQVPQVPSRPVRLATPPTLLINGVDSASGSPTPQKDNSNGSIASTPRLTAAQSKSDDNIDGDLETYRESIGDLVELFSIRLLHGKLVGRSAPMTNEEAKAMAECVIKKLSASFIGIDLHSTSKLCAVHLGMGSEFGMNYGSCGSLTVNIHPSSSTSHLQNSTVDVLKGCHYVISYDYSPAPGIIMNASYDSSGTATSRRNTMFSDDFNDNMGIDDYSGDDNDGDIINPSSETIWKQRYMRLKRQMQKKEQALGQYKRNILQAVMGDM